MPLKFCPSRGLFVLFFVVALLAPQAADRKHKSTATDKAKEKAKAAQNSKQPAKSVRETRREKAEREKQLARKKKDDEEDKRGKKAVAAKQREEKNDKSRGKEKLAKRESDKKKGNPKDRLTRREDDKKVKKEDVAAKKSPPEKDTKRGKNAKETTLAEAKDKPKAGKAEEKGSVLAKQPAAAGRAERNQEAMAEEKTKVLPSGRFILRPIAKAAPKVDLKFSVARAAAIASIDAPPPRETGPDVIDVIEHSSPAEAKRLDELVRSEMKTPSVSSIPSVSHKKLDVGKMESERIRQIQEALAKKGYYAGEISGEYNEATIAAMRKFQEEHKIDVTGYATAQSLKLLGLTDW